MNRISKTQDSAPKYAQIALMGPFPQGLTYQTNPQHPPIQIGQRVKVPLRNRIATGIVVELKLSFDLGNTKIKCITEVLDDKPLFSENQLKFYHWLAQYYHHPIGEVLLPILPKKIKEIKAWQPQQIQYSLSQKGKSGALVPLKGKQQIRLLEQFKIHHCLCKADLKALQIPAQVLQTLIDKGWISTQSSALTPRISNTPTTSPIIYSEEQQQAIEAIVKQMDHFNPFLLHGMTGSGKTEVYLAAIEQVIQSGGQALVMVPEIGLTPQNIQRFTAKLSCPVITLHSRITEGEKLKVWSYITQSNPLVVIGTRSALMLPFENLKLIVVDESHDLSYKQHAQLRYHARDSALMRGKIEDIPIILGTATPTLETLHNVNKQKLARLTLSQRITQGTTPKFNIIDMRQHPTSSGISHALMVKIKEHLANQGQVLIFINRRGFAPRLQCQSCHAVIECSRCDRPFTLHLNPKRLSCHLCGISRQTPPACPNCQSSAPFLQMGIATEKIEAMLCQKFPEHRVIRIDRSSTSTPKQFNQAIEQVEDKSADILVGTQMIAKGHDFKHITLVGIIDIDSAFYSHDFRALEHSFQLITQVAGRAGRHQQQADICIQTQCADHPLLNLMLEQGYSAFAQALMTERQTLMLPPYQYTCLIHAKTKKQSLVHQFLQQLKQQHQSDASRLKVDILGPAEALVAKEQGNYRGQLLLQSPTRSELHQLLNMITQYLYTQPSTPCQWAIDVDPVVMS